MVALDVIRELMDPSTPFGADPIAKAIFDERKRGAGQKIIETLREAMDWVEFSPHGVNCSLIHAPNSEKHDCDCGKDVFIDSIHSVLSAVEMCP